jgi:hypothetical protein
MPPSSGGAAQRGDVAAGIEQRKAQLLRARQRGRHPLERHGLELHVAVGFQRGIDGDQVVGAADLDPVPGVVDHGPIGRDSLSREGA